MIFERAFTYLGGMYDEIADGIYQITYIPDLIVQRLKEQFKIYAELLTSLYFFFDKTKFLEYQSSTAQYGKAHYINPGNALFDCLVDTVRDSFRNEMLKGTVLVSPEDKRSFFAFFVKNQIQDNRPTQRGEPNIANELLSLICQDEAGVFHQTSPAGIFSSTIFSSEYYEHHKRYFPATHISALCYFRNPLIICSSASASVSPSVISLMI